MANRVSLVLITATIVWVSPCATANAAGTPSTKCAAAKQKAATKATAAKVKCHTKAQAEAVATDPVCLQKVDEKLQKAFSAAEAKGGCVITGDLTTVAALVDAFVADLLDLTPALACPGGQIVGNFCWYVSPLDCDTACVNAGKSYDEATRTFAGSDGSDGNCWAVGAAFGFAPGISLSTGGLGCYQYGPLAVRDLDPTTSSASGLPRFCACR